MTDNLTTRQKFDINKSGLHSRIAQAASSAPDAEASTMPNRVALLLDDSGSMASSADDSSTRFGDSKTKIDHLKDAITAFVNACDFSNTSVSLDTFPMNERNSCVQTRVGSMLVSTALMLQAAGDSTPLTETMDYVLYNHPLTRGIIISDGAADSRDSVLRSARQYAEAQVPLDCVHIGRNDDGASLLKQVAEITGGMFFKFDNLQNFAKAFKFLSPVHRAQLTAGSAAMLGAKEVK